MATASNSESVLEYIGLERRPSTYLPLIQYKGRWYYGRFLEWNTVLINAKHLRWALDGPSVLYLCFMLRENGEGRGTTIYEAECYSRSKTFCAGRVGCTSFFLRRSRLKQMLATLNRKNKRPCA